jgi:hypothetical protein
MSVINLSSAIRLFVREPDSRANPSRIPIGRLLRTSRVSLLALAIPAVMLSPAYVEARALDAPATSLDRDPAQPVLTKQVDDLVPALALRARPQQTLRGVIAGVDQRNDRITVRLTSLATVDLKVQDGLLFDSVRYGDAVELTVETIDEEKTIVGLKKE